jgi:hypothetical protein
MGRLVDIEDVKDFINGLDSLPWEEEVDDLVKTIPTAFDVEKVVAELKKMRNEDNQGCKRVQGWKCHSYSDCGLCIMDRTIDIVERVVWNE